MFAPHETQHLVLSEESLVATSTERPHISKEITTVQFALLLTAEAGPALADAAEGRLDLREQLVPSHVPPL